VRVDKQLELAIELGLLSIIWPRATRGQGRHVLWIAFSYELHKSDLSAHLPHQHAKFVACAVEKVRLNFNMLSQHVETQRLQ